MEDVSLIGSNRDNNNTRARATHQRCANFALMSLANLVFLRSTVLPPPSALAEASDIFSGSMLLLSILAQGVSFSVITR